MDEYLPVLHQKQFIISSFIIIEQIVHNHQNNKMSGQTKLETRLLSTPPLRKTEKQKPSCVLLVCVYDTIIFQITNALVYDKFQEFGTIIRILIFQRKEVTKLFVEYETSQSAAKAKQVLDGKKLHSNICKMSIYYSTFQNVDLKHQTSEGTEYYNQRSQHQKSISLVSQKSPTKNLDDFEEFQAFGYKGGVHKLGGEQQNSFLPRSKTDVNEIQWHLNKIKKQECNWSGLLYIDQTIKSDIDSILNCEVDEYQKWSLNSQTNESPKRVLTPKIKQQQYKDQNLTVVGFKIKSPIKHYQVYNLFSNFGNISMIMTKKSQIRIKFRTVQFAAIAKNYLHNTFLFKQKLQLVSYPSNSCYPEEGEYAELVCYDQSSDRFTQKKSITINPPSKVLHISGMKRQKCTIYEINNMFRHIIEPTRVKVLKQNSDKNMALVQFESFEDSFEVVAECHNMIVGGRKIQISFTKSQI